MYQDEKLVEDYHHPLKLKYSHHRIFFKNRYFLFFKKGKEKEGKK